MNFNKSVVVSLVALMVASAAILTALNERISRSPSALLQANGKLQMLYPYGWSGYPYDGYGPYPTPYDPYGYGYGYDGYADYYDGYQQYAAAVQQQQYSDYLQQRQYNDWAQQQAYYNWAAVNSAYKSKDSKNGDVLRVADGANGQKLVYMGDFEFNGYKHEITGGNDGGFNAPFDINGDGQEIDNWAKVSTQWKHRRGSAQLAQKRIAGEANLQQLAQKALPDPAWAQAFSWYHGNTKPWAWFKNPPGLPSKGQRLPGGRIVH